MVKHALLAGVGLVMGMAALALGTPEAHPVKPAFIIGVFSQPIDSFASWKARGINTLVRYESQGGRVGINDWTGVACDQNLFMIREPCADPKEDVDEPYLLAWMHADEPDVRNPPDDPEPMAATYARLKGIGKNVPVFVNFSGGNVLFRKTPRETYDAYIKTADWIGNDFYPVTGWNKPQWLDHVGKIVDLLREWSGGKPQFAFIESSPQLLPWTPANTPGVTPDQLRAEIWDAVIHGVKGIVYFPQQIGQGFKYDATPALVNAEMTRQNRVLTELGEVLASAANPPQVEVSVSEPLETAWRIKDGVKYLIVLNLSDHDSGDQRIGLKGITATEATIYGKEQKTVPISQGVLIDNLGPFEVRIYVIK